VVDEHKAQFWATVFPRLRLHRELAVRTGGDVAWALRKGSPKLRALINAYVAEAGEGSATGNVLLRRYLHDNAWVRNPAPQQELRKFRATVGFFRKYADRYGFDYLMVAAQAYQESRLEQKLRSRSGAVGVMQIKPSTAAAPPIPTLQYNTRRVRVSHAKTKAVPMPAPAMPRDIPSILCQSAPPPKADTIGAALNRASVSRRVAKLNHHPNARPQKTAATVAKRLVRAAPVNHAAAPTYADKTTPVAT